LRIGVNIEVEIGRFLAEVEGFAHSVPVLGTMAYLETAEERRIVARHRRRVSLAAASFVVLSLSLVTVYYVAPMRLHPVVLQALALLLGASR